MSSGSVYVLANSSMPGLVKVGKTTRDPQERAAELSSATGLPTPFIVVYDHHFEDCSAAEQFAHAYLEARGYRVSDNREFFSAPTAEIVRALTAFAATVQQRAIVRSDSTEIVRELASFSHLIQRLTPVNVIDAEIVRAFTEFSSTAINSESCNEGDVLIVQAVAKFSASIQSIASEDGGDTEIVRAFTAFALTISQLKPASDEDFIDAAALSATSENFDPHESYRSTQWFAVLEQAELLHAGDEQTPSDYPGSLKLLKQAARLGALSSYSLIAKIYADGRGVTPNERSQMRWLTDGANKGCLVCYWKMSLLFAKQGDITNARRAFAQFLLDFDGRDRANGQRKDIEWRRWWSVLDDCVMMMFYKYLGATLYDPMYDTFISRLVEPITREANSKLLMATTNNWPVNYCKALERVAEHMRGLQEAVAIEQQQVSLAEGAP